jgi:hypothetical protein
MALLEGRIRDKPANSGGRLSLSGGGSRECTPIGKEDGLNNWFHQLHLMRQEAKQEGEEGGRGNGVRKMVAWIVGNIQT